jgi:hypothetical protein
MAYTPNIFDYGVEPDLSDGKSMVCVWGQRGSDEYDQVEVVIRFNWEGGGTDKGIPCDDDESAQAVIDAIARNADRAAVHIAFNV